MLIQVRRICILAFVISTLIHFSKARTESVSSPIQIAAPTQLPTQAAAAIATTTEAPVAAAAFEQISLTPSLRSPTKTSTTTTLASSNAPATTTIESASGDVSDAAAATTAQQNIKVNTDIEFDVNGVATTALSLDEMLQNTEVPTSVAKDQEGKPMPTAKSSNGNELSTQIKNEDKEMPSRPEAIQEVTQKNEEIAEMENGEELKNQKEITKPVTQQLDQDLIVSETTMATVESNLKPFSKIESNNHVHVERKLENGLYRIKLAEIVTDEFAGQPEESTAERTLSENDHESGHNSKMNIADLYPATKEDFHPLLRDSNTKLLEERMIFKKLANDDEYRQNLLPNEVEVQGQEKSIKPEEAIFGSEYPRPKPQHLSPTIEMTLMNSDNSNGNDDDNGDSISEFTGKLLAEQDGVITEIEQKFRVNDYAPTSEKAAVTVTATAITSITAIGANVNPGTHFSTTDKTSTTKPAAATASSSTSSTTSTLTGKTGIPKPMKTAKSAKGINHQLVKVAGKGHSAVVATGTGTGTVHEFIERRVKKSFAFPMHREASDVMSAPYVDFANTKFTSGGIIGNGSPAAKAKTFTGDSSVNSGIDGGGSSKSYAGIANASNTPNAAGIGIGSGSSSGSGVAHPEFSTTKFYNSKELYNEMVMHSKQKQLQTKSIKVGMDFVQGNTLATTTTSLPGAASRYATPKTSMKLDIVSKDTMGGAAAAAVIKEKILSATRSSTSSAEPNIATITSIPISKKFQKEFQRAKLLLKAMRPSSTATTRKTTYADADAPITTTTTRTSALSTSSATAQISTKAFSPFANKSASKVLPESPSQSSSSSLSSSLSATATSSLGTLSSAVPQTAPREIAASAATTTTATAIITTMPTTSPLAITKAKATKITNAKNSRLAVAFATSSAPQLRTTNPAKSASKPIARPRILSRLQEKINSLECEMQNVPEDSHLWRGNETHELLLPIVTPAHCSPEKDGQQKQPVVANSQQDEPQRDCTTTPITVSWDGESEIQSGDILIVEINDASLLSDKNHTSSAHNTQVYQVTRSGHEHCDVTEGILLDITPLVVDGRKLVTLYDKDLTEGVNLLIVVSELWGSQCVRLKVTTKTDNCGENADCSGKGVCYSNPAMEEYECQCCGGFAGPHCEEIDACTPSPCTNNGICVDLSQGHEGNSYQCLCPYGYTGKNCQYETEPCNPAECMNGGSCVGNATHFRCDCTPGFTGPLCQHSLNECESSPCVHGICVDQEDGFRCFCQPGFAGELCNFEYNECESNPCQNEGECIDHIGSYECRCTKGYTGNRCQIKVDFCSNKPCPDGHRCIDHGNDFSCECPGGRNGPDCNQMARTQCNVNPCTHGGTCWSSGDSFYCACRPGYTGNMCEDEFVVETVVSSSEFIVDDTSTRNFNDKTFGSPVVLKSPIELHNAYFAAGVLAAAFFIVAVVVTICHCKVNQTYRKFSTRTSSFIPIIGFGRRPKPQNKLNKHWLSGKGLNSGNSLRSSSSSARAGSGGHLLANNNNNNNNNSHQSSSNHQHQQQHQQQHAIVGGQLQERPFQRHLAMNLENDMYYTVDFSENSQHSPLIQ